MSKLLRAVVLAVLFTGLPAALLATGVDLRVVGVSGSPSVITLNTGNITYTTQLFNNSTSQGTNPVLTMTIPASSTFVSASATSSGTCNQSAGVVTCNWSSIPASNN